MATGVFNTARRGANLRSKKYRGHGDAIAKFTKYLSEHDIEKGDPGGSVTLAASRAGISARHGYTLFKRICQELGPQAS